MVLVVQTNPSCALTMSVASAAALRVGVVHASVSGSSHRSAIQAGSTIRNVGSLVEAIACRRPFCLLNVIPIRANAENGANANEQ